MEYTFLVQLPDIHKRLDHFLVEKAVPYSRSRIKKWVDKGRGSVNGIPEKSSYRLKAGDFLEFFPEEPIPLALTPENIPLTILYEDRDLLVLEKPAGLVVHPAPGNYSGTMVHALLFHCRDLSGIGGVLRPGIVHRLDKDTSGLMVVAKNDISHQRLIRQFQTGQVIKEYQTLIWGNPKVDRGRIEKPIGRHPVQRKKMAVNTVHGKPAVTEWQVLERFSQEITWLNLTLKTGRTHQIRVHLSSQGWPVVGDPLYGGKKHTLSMGKGVGEEEAKGISRQLLHAFRLAFFHPTIGNYMDFSSIIPKDMEDLIQYLRTGSTAQKICGYQP